LSSRQIYEQDKVKKIFKARSAAESRLRMPKGRTSCGFKL